MKLTTEQKQQKQQRDNLNGLCNRLLSAFNFKTIHTWNDVFKMEGMVDADISNLYPALHNKPITFSELKQHCNELKEHLEQSINNRNEPKVGQERDNKTGEEVIVRDVATTEETEEDKATEENDYGLIPSPTEAAFHFWFQKRAIAQLHKGITVEKKRGLLLLAATGTGKTFMAGALLRRLVDSKFADGKTFGATKYLYVTRATIVEQTKRVFEKFYKLSIKDAVEVLNIEQLRSRAGAVWLNEKEVVQNGECTILWEWHKFLHPCVILWDECQSLKNEGSTQHKIAASFNDINSADTFQVFISATPFTRVSESKCFAVATHKNISDKIGLGHTSVLTNSNWPTYASAIASPSGPDEYNEAAVERLVKDLEPYIVRVRGVRSQFNAHNSIKMIHFRNKEEENFYHEAYNRYQIRKAKLDAEKEAGATNIGFAQLVEFLMFRMAAEKCRAGYLAEEMYRIVCHEGKAAVAALNFKGSIIKIVQELEKKGVTRDQISIIWGGGATAVTKKQRNMLEIAAKADQLVNIGMSLDEVLKMLDITQEDLIAARVRQEEAENLPDHLRLGMQSKEERQREIDKFQSGKTLYCLYTFRAGGVGLSLHHTDEMTSFKCRRKRSGYAVEEDIPKVPVRARKNLVAPTYSAMEMVQGLGRCPRLTSLSDTEQLLIFYAGTIEESVANITSQKLRCLTRVVRQRESWQDIIIGGVSADSHIDNTKDMQPDNPDELATEQEDGEE